MSAPTNTTSMDALDFYRRMFLLDVNWPDEADGYSFHAYPNPGFSARPSLTGRHNVGSYLLELRLIHKFNPSSKPYIISETGSVNPQSFYPTAMKYFLDDPGIIAVTPFLLFAGEGSFSRFSLLNRDYSPTSAHVYLSGLAKTTGSPLLSDIPVSPETDYIYPDILPNINPSSNNSPDRLYWWLYEMVSGSGH